MKRILGSMVAVLVILSVIAPVSHTAVLADPDDFAGGDGSESNPYQIEDWHHLDSVRGHLGDHFILMNDLDADTDGYDDLAGPNANSNQGWQPIGGSFTGKFDGRGYEIRDLVISRPSEDNIGLFRLTTSAFIDAVGLANVQVTGSSYVGALVGENAGTVTGCYATGSVTGAVCVGGLVGLSWATVSNSYSTCSVTGDASVGGLIGYAKWKVEDCYATGNLTGDYVGGLVGEMDSGTVTNCYATGSVTVVTGGSTAGGLIAQNYSTVSGSFWDTETTGMATSAGGTGKTTAQMLQNATFASWDMTAVAHSDIDPSSIWNIVDGRCYPFFGWLRMRFELKAGWNMVSVSRELPPGKNTVAEVFKGEIVAIYTWNPTTKSYVVPATVEPNCGYWVAVTEDKTIAYLMAA